ncbi:cilia- and flagella-associated protein 43-like [Hylaeus anthracinus]|uniref:cilia- and flagella-associated protein 43-like n=1 Tax=Hylaeus anthracinus TaxID=313031 RepID=UPI0023B97B3B|nr:cilia- and flagella-associated protein 43-like [Hylaeus anthracinus]
MRFTTVEPSWAIFGKSRDIAYIGRDAIGIVSGIYARFFDARNGESRIERFDGHERGDGASCIAGHSVASIFSLVERRPNPRISIFGYPSIQRIACCANSRDANGYTCCAFTSTEYLLGQTIYPDCLVILWHWRTGDRVITIDAGTIDLCSTIIACSNDSPQLVGRLAPDSGTLSVYRILVCSKIVRLFPIEVAMDSSRKPVAFSWSTGGTLLLCDELGTIWSVDLDENENRRVQTIVQASFRSQRNPVLVAHKGGALIVQVHAETDHKVRATFYRKESKERSENWSSVWTTLLPSYPSWARSHPHDDKILILGENGEIFEMICSSRDKPPRLDFLLREGSSYTAIAPFSNQYLGAMGLSQRLVVLDTFTGNVVTVTKHLSLKHHGEVVCLISHPSTSILATCSATGSCVFVDASAPSSPKILSCVHLQNEPLNRMKFSEEGRILGVGSSQPGRLFLLVATKCSGETSIKVTATVIVQRKIVDFLVYETEERRATKVLVLVECFDSKDSRVGDEILVYSSELNGAYRETADRAIKLTASFESLLYGREGSGEIFGAPYLSRQLHRIQFKANFSDAVVLDALPSLHLTRNVEIGFHRTGTRSFSRFLSCGYDGLIILRDASEPQRVLAVFVGHHRTQGGTRCAAIVGDSVVSLGRNGDLVANRLRQPFVLNPSNSPGIFVNLISDESARSETGGTNNGGEQETIAADRSTETWMEAIMRDKTMTEKKQDLSARLSILHDLNGIKCRVKTLLDSNENESSDARLPISAFDLDQAARECKLIEMKSIQEQLIKDSEERIASRERAISFLRKRFLEPLLVLPRTISSIFGESKVANYPLVKIASREADHRSWCRFSMEIRELVSRFEEEISAGTLKEQTPFYPWRGYVDVLQACAVAEERELDFKIRFNENFEETRSAKKNETKMAIERVRKTRRCVDELKQMFLVDASSDILDISRWRGIEMVDDCDDFLSPCSESINPKEEEDYTPEEEICSRTVRFRLQTLERMMNGVLEVRLEDNAKRFIPKPKCLGQKDPSIYTKKEVVAIESYEREVRAREAYRSEYRSMLEDEIERVKDQLSNGGKAFDDKLANLAAEKIRVERSVLLERLSKVQMILGHRRIARQRREILRVTEMELIPATKQTRSLAEECELFEAGIVELRNRYENLRKRDKQLEGRFRVEFESELKQPMVDHLFRQYRRRPRTAGAVCGTSLVFLAELAERVIEDRNRESQILPREWQDYLRALEALDAVPDSLPSRIDPCHWRTTCRLRRLKVEAEIKVRSCAIELAEAEQSLAFYRKACLVGRVTVNRRKETVQRLEKSLADLTDDTEVPLVLKTGQLQKQPRGDSSSEWEEAILIPRRELDRVKEAIVKAGEQKLAALQQVARLKRTTSLAEWRHGLVKKTMEDLQESLKDLSSVKVSRIVRECVDRYPSGTIPKKEMETLEKNFRVRQTKLEEAMEEERARLRRIANEARKWRETNAKLVREIERSTTERDKLVVATSDPLRSKAAAFQRKKMRAIRRKTRLARTIRDNLEELLVLHSRLEISKLKTYPTLRFKI